MPSLKGLQNASCQPPQINQAALAPATYYGGTSRPSPKPPSMPWPAPKWRTNKLSLPFNVNLARCRVLPPPRHPLRCFADSIHKVPGVHDHLPLSQGVGPWNKLGVFHGTSACRLPAREQPRAQQLDSQPSAITTCPRQIPTDNLFHENAPRNPRANCRLGALNGDERVWRAKDIFMSYMAHINLRRVVQGGNVRVFPNEAEQARKSQQCRPAPVSGPDLMQNTLLHEGAKQSVRRSLGHSCAVGKV